MAKRTQYGKRTVPIDRWRTFGFGNPSLQHSLHCQKGTLIMTRDELIELSKEVAIINEKWTRNPETGEKIIVPLRRCLILIISEIIEAMEGERKDLMDTHLSNRKMAEVEMADTMIRLLDLCNRFDVRIAEDFGSEECKYEFDFPSKEENLYELVEDITLISITEYMGKIHSDDITRSMEGVIDYCEKWGYDLRGAIREKMEYNKNREDHKIESRLAANGKKW